MKKKKMIVGNWKMNGNLPLVKEIVEGIVSAVEKSHNHVIVIPPTIYLFPVINMVKNMGIGVGAQNVSQYKSGAYTGEVSCDMLVDVGCQYVLVGHSERRQLFGEDDALVAEKVKLVLDKNLIPIVCVGETLAERESDAWQEVVRSQLMSVVRLCGVESFGKIIVAYEPVWAIGTGRSASAEIANEVHEFIYCTLVGMSDKIRDSLNILYGGSVTAENSALYMSQSYIDGVLVGGAALKPDVFSNIILSVE